MPIPESQLERWSHQGAVTTAKKTHESIRNALDPHTWPTGVKYEVYLQGSYKNTTNIHGDSDVDVVAQLDSTFQSDLSELTDYQKTLHKQAHPDATYLWENFRTDVLTALRNYFGYSAVDDTGNKSLKVVGTPNRLPADVVTCMQYRKYKHFRSLNDQNYVEGMVFYTLRERRKVINFPKVHYQNGTEKNGRTSSRYKPTIRVFKNARTYLVNQGIITKELAPSYFLECLLYNVPDVKFTYNHQTTFCSVVNWLQEADMTRFVCQNEQLYLFGSTPEQWSSSDAQHFLNMLVYLWNNWK